MINKEARARQAQHELDITQEAADKLKGYWIEEAVKAASAGHQAEAHNLLLKINALETIRMMVRTPIDDWTVESALAKANTPN